MAAAVGLVGALVGIGGAIAVEVVDHDATALSNCTAEAVSDFMYLYDDGVITHEEFEALRSDAIDDEISDVAECP